MVKGLKFRAALLDWTTAVNGGGRERVEGSVESKLEGEIVYASCWYLCTLYSQTSRARWHLLSNQTWSL